MRETETATEMENVWKYSWECVRKELENTSKKYEAIIEKKNQEIRRLVSIIERGGK